MPHSRLNKLNIAQIFCLLFLVSIFFPVRFVFPTREAFQTGQYSDFTSISLYLSDILLIITCFFTFLPRGGREFWSGIKGKGLRLFIIWLILGIIWHFSSLSSLNWWFFAKYLELVVAYETIYYLFRKTDIKPLFIRAFVTFSSFEAILALVQFKIQKSVGLGLARLGEQVIGPNLQGIAKIVSGGTKFIRGYGTFPHPNLLSAFLISGIFLCLYLLLSSNTLKSRLIYSLSLFINILGLTVTFSRGAYLALAVGLMIFFGLLFYKYFIIARIPSLPRRQAGRAPADKAILSQGKIALTTLMMAIVLVSIAISFFLFKPFLLTRATISDDAALQRIFYDKIGIKIIKQHPMFGVGIGESVLSMQQYSPIKLWPWQIQPIHNYFLLVAAELGIPSALIIIWIFFLHLKSLIFNLKSRFTIYSLLLTTILTSFLILMMFDHYFYTLAQTQMLLWLALGIIAAEIKNPEAQSFEI